MKKTLSRIGFVTLFQFALLLCAGYGRAALFPEFVTVNFNNAIEQDYSVYTEKGFSLTPSLGKVRLNSAFPPGSIAAAPSFGFGQDNDSSFTFSNRQHRVFTAVSIDLLEATGHPAPFGITMIGTKADSTVVTQTFTLDGIAGAQKFIFSSDFNDLVSLKIAKDYSDSFNTEDVQIDNVRFFLPADTFKPQVKTEIFGQVSVATTNLAGLPPIPIEINFPLTAHIAIYDANSKLVQWSYSNRKGEFQAALFPGDYTLVGATLHRKQERFVSQPVHISIPSDGLNAVVLEYGIVER